MTKFIKLISILLFCGGLASAQSYAKFNGACTQGGTKAQLSGMSSTNYQQSSFPQCTVTVYLHGTLTKATIYSDSGVTPLANPFTAGTNGLFGFYYLVTSTYDAVMSATGMTTTTISDISTGGGGSPGGAAGGDLSGSYPNPTVARLNGNPITSTTPTNTSMVPKWNGSSYDAGQLSYDDLLPAFTISSFTCSTCGVKEFGLVVPSPTNFTLAYTGGPPTSASVTDGTNTTNLTSPFTSGSLAFSYTCGTTPGTLKTFTASAAKGSITPPNATQTISCQPRTFYGVGTGGATGATASGNNAVLVGATGTLGTWGLGTNTGTVSVSPSSQYIYFLLSTGGHTFTVNGFTTTFSCSAITFVNQNSSSVPMQLCVSPTFYTGTYTVGVS